MSGFDGAPIAALVALGAVHGINPAMGWLFAVALGLQEKKGRAVWRALPPLALGHAASVAVVVLIGVFIGRFLSPLVLKWSVAGVLLAFGVLRLRRRHRHPRFGGMRVTPRELAAWSFLMATAHGAGLMVLPFIIGTPDAPGAHAAHALHIAETARAVAAPAHAALLRGELAAVAAAAVHAASYLVVTGVIAVVVYERVGLKLLRTAWINLDVLWAVALLVTAVLTPLI